VAAESTGRLVYQQPRPSRQAGDGLAPRRVRGVGEHATATPRLDSHADGGDPAVVAGRGGDAPRGVTPDLRALVVRHRLPLERREALPAGGVEGVEQAPRLLQRATGTTNG